tara:strand:+ start:63 stop:308 length:246 start_codon:yes stop_codon:yes gene_type:complete
MKKSTANKIKKNTLLSQSQGYFLGVVARFALIIGGLAFIYGMFFAPMFLASNYMIMSVLFIGAGVYLRNVYKKKYKKSIWF